MTKKVMTAMSGGVDSSVAALLLKEDGYDVTGVMMKLFLNEDIGLADVSGCCSLEDAEDARAVAHDLGIPFYVLNFTEKFREEVIDRFVDSYTRGETPNPCIDCNKYMKFGMIIERAKLLDFDYIATGHYAKIEKHGDRYLLKKAVDTAKDQSYVLYSLTQEQLAYTLFPLGGMTKPEIRKIAAEHNLVSADKRDSFDICFAPDGDYAKFIERATDKTFPVGDFVSSDGTVLGKHKGIPRYTIGQRRGLGISADSRLFVTDIRADENKIVLGKEDDLFTKSFYAKDINLIVVDKIDKPIRTKARIRYHHQEQPATVEQLSDNLLHIEFDKPQRAVTPGQAVVLYDDDVVVGGGTIALSIQKLGKEVYLFRAIGTK